MLNALTKQPFPIDFGHFNEGLAMVSTVCIVGAIFSLIDEVTNVRRVQKHLRQFISCGMDNHFRSHYRAQAAPRLYHPRCWP